MSSLGFPSVSAVSTSELLFRCDARATFNRAASRFTAIINRAFEHPGQRGKSASDEKSGTAEIDIFAEPC